MSVKISAKVWRYGPTRPADRLMLLALADHADDRGASWPGMDLLAEKCAVKVRAAQSTIRRLEADGWISTTPGGGRRRSNRYVINREKLHGNPVVHDGVTNPVVHDGVTAETLSSTTRNPVVHDGGTVRNRQVPPPPSSSSRASEEEARRIPAGAGGRDKAVARLLAEYEVEDAEVPTFVAWIHEDRQDREPIKSIAKYLAHLDNNGDLLDLVNRWRDSTEKADQRKRHKQWEGLGDRLRDAGLGPHGHPNACRDRGIGAWMGFARGEITYDQAEAEIEAAITVFNSDGEVERLIREHVATEEEEGTGS